MSRVLTISDLIKFADDFMDGIENFGLKFMQNVKSESEKLNEVIKEKEKLERLGREEKTLKIQYRILISKCDRILEYIGNEWLNVLYNHFYSQFEQQSVLIYLGFLAKNPNFRKSLLRPDCSDPFFDVLMLTDQEREFRGEELKKKALEYSGKAKKWGKKLLKKAKNEARELLRNTEFLEYRENLVTRTEKVRKELKTIYCEL